MNIEEFDDGKALNLNSPLSILFIHFFFFWGGGVKNWDWIRERGLGARGIMSFIVSLPTRAFLVQSYLTLLLVPFFCHPGVLKIRHFRDRYDIYNRVSALFVT